MNEHIPKPLRQLQDYGAQLVRQAEYAEALVTRLNEELQKLAALRVLPDLTYVGEVVLTEPYEEEADAGRAYVAVLNTAQGFGVMQMETGQVGMLDLPGEIDNAEIKNRMVRFADLPLRIKARLAPQVTGLMDRLFYDVNVRPFRPAGE